MNPDSDQWEEEAEIMVPGKPTWATILKRFINDHWHPRPMDSPVVDPDLHRLSWIERSAEVLRHSLQSLEYWASPNGWLREWLRFNTKACLVLAVPSLMVIPLVSFTLGQFNEWTRSLAQTTNTLLYFPLSALLMIGLIAALVYFARSLRRRPHPRDPYYHQ